MSHRYAPLPNSRSDVDAHNEMEAAFDDSEDEDEHNTSESHPLNPLRTDSAAPRTPQTPSRIPGTYDFENIDYDYPPPGSPPGPSAIALPNNHGNSNGLIPSFSLDTVSTPRRSWFKRTVAAVLPTAYVRRFGIETQHPVAAVGGGTNNDGVFANVTAKPSRPLRIQDGDETYLVPEDSRAEAPPSYASAQADAVPPYWETTIHAPFSPDSIGEMIIDNLPTGSLFSFLWNMLVSISFQFIGFLLTYLLHTTHAARLGSRAGLGVTLIQYGFALRNKAENAAEGNGDVWGGWRMGEVDPALAALPTAAAAEEYHNRQMMGNVTSTLTEEQANIFIADATTEWLSFFLMTIGWFILLTSVLGFWRVKRWERGIMSSQQPDNTTTPSQEQRINSFTSQFERAFGLRGISRGDFFRQGLGLGGARMASPDEAVDEAERVALRAEEGALDIEMEMRDREHDLVVPIDPNDPNRDRILTEALLNERRLHEDLRAAGLF